MEICKSLEKTKNTPEIELCAKYFKQAGHHTFAKQAYLRLGDLRALMQLHVDCQKWDEAFMLAKQNPEMESMITLPYADWLSTNDRFEEAQQAYKKANRPDLSLKIIEFLSNNAISEKRFQDAAQYYWMLATESLSLVRQTGAKATKDDKKYLKSFDEYSKLAEIYQAYNHVSKFAEEKYSSVIQGPLYYECVFNAARFLVNNLGNRQPLGINKVYIYHTLATLGYKFEAYMTARLGYDMLASMKVPEHLLEEIEIEALKIKTKPISDKEGFHFSCNRCMIPQPLVNQAGDFCINCGAPVIRNFGSFDTLPLVEFVPDGNVPPAKVLELLKIDSPLEMPSKNVQSKRP